MPLWLSVAESEGDKLSEAESEGDKKHQPSTGADVREAMRAASPTTEA